MTAAPPATPRPWRTGIGRFGLGSLAAAAPNLLLAEVYPDNRGKGARLLEEGTAPAINRSAITEMAERVEQAKAYMELLGSMQTITEDQVWRVRVAWAVAYKASLVERDEGTFYEFEYGNWPEDRSIRQFIRKLGLSEVLDAVDIAASRIPVPTMDAVRYFYGVCHTAIREGREPLSKQPDREDHYVDGLEHGRKQERERLGDILLNYQEHGYAYLSDAVSALWPTDD